MHVEHHDSNRDIVSEIGEEDQEYSHAVMQKHIPGLGVLQFIERVVDQCVEVRGELNHVEWDCVWDVLDEWVIVEHIDALTLASESFWEEILVSE